LTAATPISVVVASHGRPAHLRRCLTALGYQSHPRFEIVVVADSAGAAALEGHRSLSTTKLKRFDEAHLSKARNLGLSASAGQIVAFLDDDAVPEPTWLAHLARAFDRQGAPAAVGAVRGRNGISYQSHTPMVDRHGFTRDPVPRGAPPHTGFVPKLVGTNMAVRRDVLRDLGGFDEAFRFYLEDTDLSLRLAAAGHVPLFVPEAEVQHEFAASARRAACRRPTSLVEIGRSLAIFLRKHGDPAQFASMEEVFRAQERCRLMRHMVRGSCEPRDVRRLLDGFDRGFDKGRRADFALYASAGEPPAFCRSRGLPDNAECHLIAGRPWNARELSQKAAGLAKEGHVVTLMLFSPTTLYHRRRFDPAGYWVETGGTLGRSQRTDPVLRVCRFADRVRLEWADVETPRRPAETIIRSHL
jgi:GT2 family glycosyltransferase